MRKKSEEQSAKHESQGAVLREAGDHIEKIVVDFSNKLDVMSDEKACLEDEYVAVRSQLDAAVQGEAEAQKRLKSAQNHLQQPLKDLVPHEIERVSLKCDEIKRSATFIF